VEDGSRLVQANQAILEIGFDFIGFGSGDSPAVRACEGFRGFIDPKKI
jgi:hypothetical protein